MNKVVYTEEVIEIIEALPVEYQSEVFSLINSYVLRGYIPENPSPVAEAIFMSLRAKFDRQAHGARKKEPPQQSDTQDNTDEYTEKIFAPEELENGVPAEIVRKSKEKGVKITNIRRFYDFARSNGELHKFRTCEFSMWQNNILKILPDFAVTTYARSHIISNPPAA